MLRTYGKVAVKAHERTNCVTELLLPEAESWAQSEVNLKGPLAGVPVSLKDSIQVKGFDISLGYTKLAEKPYREDGGLVKLLKDAGMSHVLVGFYVELMIRRCPVRENRLARHPPVIRVCQCPLGPLSQPACSGLLARWLYRW